MFAGRPQHPAGNAAGSTGAQTAACKKETHAKHTHMRDMKDMIENYAQEKSVFICNCGKSFMSMLWLH